jgi:hypothetical protein
MRVINAVRLALLFPVLAVGCITPRFDVGQRGLDQVGTHEIQNLQRVASREISCPVDELYAQPISDRVWRVTGCNVSAEYSMTRGRMGPRRWTQVVPVESRAANDLGCPIDRVAVETTGPEARRVSGCGVTAQYELACTSETCGWTQVAQSVDGDVGVRVPAPTRPVPTQRAPSEVMVVVPEGSSQSAAEQFVRGELDRQRDVILACARGATPVVLRARWGPDGDVRVRVDPSSAAGRAIEPCVVGSTSPLRVTDGQPGDIVHVVR